jgi:Na+-transporting NADH:ubiquinone oxidoreductase subunit NqrE
VKTANLALRFALELCAFAALGYWGSQATSSTVSRIVLAIVTPAAAIVVWGLFVAPKATVKVSEAARWAIEVVVFVGAAVALVASGHVILGLVLGAVAVANGALVRVAP